MTSIDRIDLGGGGGGSGSSDDDTRTDDPRDGPQIESPDGDERRDAADKNASGGDSMTGGDTSGGDTSGGDTSRDPWADDDDDGGSGGGSGSSGSGGSNSGPTDDEIIRTIQNNTGGHGIGGVGTAPSTPRTDPGHGGPAHDPWADDGGSGGSGGSSSPSGSGSDGPTRDQNLDLSDDQRDSLLDRFIDRNADLVDEAPDNNVDGGDFTRDDLTIRAGDDGGFIVGPSRDAVVRERSDEWVDSWISDNSDLVNTGPNDPDGGRFAPDDIVVRRTDDGGISVGPSEQAIERERDDARAQAAARNELFRSAIKDQRQTQQRERELAWLDRRDDARAASMLDKAVADYVDQAEQEQVLAAMDERDQARDDAQTEQFGDFDWSLGLGGDGDEVEQFVDDGGDRIARALDAAADDFERRENDRAAEVDRLTGGSTPGSVSSAGVSRTSAEVGEALLRFGSDAARFPSLGLEAIEAGGWFAAGATQGERAQRERAEATVDFTTTVVDETVASARRNPTDFAVGAAVGAGLGTAIGSAGRLSRVLPDRRRVREFADDDRAQGSPSSLLRESQSDGTSRFDDLPDTIGGTDPDGGRRPVLGDKRIGKNRGSGASRRARDRMRETDIYPETFDDIPTDDIRDVVDLEDTLRGDNDVAPGAGDVRGFGPLAGGTAGILSPTDDTPAGVDPTEPTVDADVGARARPGDALDELGLGLGRTRTDLDIGQPTDVDLDIDQPFDWGSASDSSTRPTPDLSPDPDGGRPWDPDPTSPRRRRDVDLGGKRRDARDGFGAFGVDNRVWDTGVAQSLDELDDDGADPFEKF